MKRRMIWHMKKTKNLGDAELEIMLAIWEAEHPLTSVQVREKLRETRDWAMASVMTSLARLVEKGFLRCDKDTGINTYTALIPEDDYKAQESQSLLTRLYGNSVPNMVTTLYGNKMLDKSDIDELRTLLDSLEGGE